MKGVRKHYLDDDLKNRRFMKDVGPASYDTLEKRVAVPVNLEPNIAPAIIYRDLKQIVNKTPMSQYLPHENLLPMSSNSTTSPRLEHQ